MLNFRPGDGKCLALASALYSKFCQELEENHFDNLQTHLKYCTQQISNLQIFLQISINPVRIPSQVCSTGMLEIIISGPQSHSGRRQPSPPAVVGSLLCPLRAVVHSVHSRSRSFSLLRCNFSQLLYGFTQVARNDPGWDNFLKI